MMYALYYVNPIINQRLACVSGRHMDFADAEPALYSQAKNIELLLRNYRKVAIGQYAIKGQRQYLAKHNAIELPGVDDPTLSCFRIVPIAILPDFAAEYQYS